VCSVDREISDRSGGSWIDVSSTVREFERCGGWCERLK
jgi:hypothetical protein